MDDVTWMHQVALNYQSTELVVNWLTNWKLFYPFPLCRIAIIKGLPGSVLQMIILRWVDYKFKSWIDRSLNLDIFHFRRKQAIEELAVKPVTQFPVEISNEDAFASFKNVRHVTIKKVCEPSAKFRLAQPYQVSNTRIHNLTAQSTATTYRDEHNKTEEKQMNVFNIIMSSHCHSEQGNASLGIMIIEGKHAEVGQGIFVSDIQEGSNAEKVLYLTFSLSTLNWQFYKQFNA